MNTSLKENWEMRIIRDGTETLELKKITLKWERNNEWGAMSSSLVYVSAIAILGTTCIWNIRIQNKRQFKKSK